MIPFILLGLIITSVYPDPLQAENGGEAVQISNPTDTPLTTDGLVLTTKTTTYTLPPATVLPGAGYLIADTGWSGPMGLRDNLTWPNADYEIGMSLANTDGFVELRNPATNTTLDRLSWNSTAKPREGYAWTKDGESIPFFLNRSMQLLTFPISYAVAKTPPSITSITVPDEAPQDGNQLLGYARTLIIGATIANPDTDTITVTAKLGGYETELTTTDNASYTGSIDLPALLAGNYELTITIETNATTVTEKRTITVIPTATIVIEPLELAGTSTTNTTGTLVVHNTGNTKRTVRIAQLPRGIHCAPERVTLDASTSASFSCSAPANNNQTTHGALVAE